MEKKCPQCSEIKDIVEFCFSKSENRYTSWCKACLYKSQSKRWKDRKRQAIELMGGKCSMCGYDKNMNALQFHHLDPSKKEANWGKISKWEWSRTVEELKKCILLCANCHFEIHSKIEDETLTGDPVNVALQLRAIESTGKCPICEVDVYGTEYCSVRCSSIANRKVVNRPTAEELAELIAKMPMTKIGEKYGVSDNAVRKWATSYEINWRKNRVDASKPTGICPECGKDVFDNDRYCSRECASISCRKVKNRPSKEELIKLLRSKTPSAIGQEYGVARNTVRDWATQYGFKPSDAKAGLLDVEN